MTKKSPVLDRMAGMVAYADKIVGRIVAHLDSLDIRDNTVILFDYIQDQAHANPINIKTAGKKARASYKMLSAVLEEMKSQFAAGDEYTGKPTYLLSTKPGLQNVKRKTERQGAQK